ASGNSEIQHMLYDGWTHDYYTGDCARLMHLGICMILELMSGGWVVSKLQHFYQLTGRLIPLARGWRKLVASLRQTAKWGVLALQGRMKYEHRGERKRICYSIMLLFNLRTRRNQILYRFTL
ncbi:hypothetical protein GN958_ATG20220, partial [Phytophthora infestans]